MTTSHAVRLGRPSAIAIALASVAGVIAFAWPLIASPQSSLVAHASDAPVLFAVLVPVLLVVVLAQLSDGGMDAKAIAMLGVLAAVIAALRPLGGGTAGLEPIWAVLILAGRAMGPGFGFSLGAIALFASALTTGGVGPWLPFQMLGAAWVGLGAGLLPPMGGALWGSFASETAPQRTTHRGELVMLAGYGALACIAYGFLLNLWFWPFTSTLPEQLAFVPGAALTENVLTWLRFCLVTSLGYDIPRAVLTVTLILVAGYPVLTALRRISRKAVFQPAPEFLPAARHEHKEPA